MRIALTVLGLDLITLEVTTDTDDQPDAYGDTASTQTGFTVTLPDRNGYEDELA